MRNSNFSNYRILNFLFRYLKRYNEGYHICNDLVQSRLSCFRSIRILHRWNSLIIFKESFSFQNVQIDTFRDSNGLYTNYFLICKVYLLYKRHYKFIWFSLYFGFFKIGFKLEFNLGSISGEANYWISTNEIK